MMKFLNINNCRFFSGLNIPSVIGHRGAMGFWNIPENTCESILAAYKMDAYGVEIDVQMTKDNQLIIYHDDILDTLTNLHGYIYKNSLFEKSLSHSISYLLGLWAL